MRHQHLRIRRHIRSIVLLAALVLTLGSLPAFAAAPSAPGASGGGSGKGTVNINSADAGKLTLLPRVGPAGAQRILEYRKQNGPFKAIEDLMHVKGIGEKTFALLKPYIAVSGETTLAEKVHLSRSSKSEGGKH